MKLIILAGGLGTRLRSSVPNLPKAMAEINKKPFLKYLIDYFLEQNNFQIYISTGYKSEVIENFIKENYSNKNIKCVKEIEPLGTGGAIKNLIDKKYIGEDEDFFVINGDTFLDIRLEELSFFHYNNNCDITLTLFSMKDFDRYGSVELKNNKIISFCEKKYCRSGLINSGVYMIHSNVFNKYKLPPNFSFEEFLIENIMKMNIGGFVPKSKYFIDIGIPSDYEKAQNDFKELF